MIFSQHNFIGKIDQIYDYQQKIIQNSSIFVQLPKPIYRNNSKHSVFEINSKIKQLVGNQHHNLRLIGCGSSAHIEAYIYCVLLLALSGKNSFIEFKKCIYKVSQINLQLQEQKMLVQFFYMVENTTDKFTFLKKYPIVQSLLIKIFIKISENNSNINNNNNNNNNKKIIIQPKYQQRIKTINNAFNNFYSNTQESRISSTSSIRTSQLINYIENVSIIYQKLTQIFNFVVLQKYTEYTYTLSIDEDNKIHIINEKQFYFVLHSHKFNFQRKNCHKANKIQKFQKIQKFSRLEKNQKTKKFQKLDKNQVKRLLNQSIQSENNQEKNSNKQFLSFLSNKDKLKLSIQNIQEINGNINFTHLNEPKVKKVSNFKINEKKQQKFIPFNKKSQFQQKSTSLNHLSKDERKIQYIDLMQSSFEDQDSTQIQNSTSNLINEHKINDYKYKYTYKNIQKKQAYPKYENKSNKSPNFLCRSPTFRTNTKNSRFQTHINSKQSRLQNIQRLSLVQRIKNKVSISTRQNNSNKNKKTIYKHKNNIKTNNKTNQLRYNNKIIKQNQHQHFSNLLIESHQKIKRFRNIHRYKIRISQSIYTSTRCDQIRKYLNQFWQQQSGKKKYHAEVQKYLN